VTAVVETPPAVARATTTAWRRIVLHCLVVPLVVTAPVFGLAPGSDHRYNVYWHGSTVQAHPWRLVTENLRTIPMYIDFGNFRPLGRMLEWTVDLAAYVFAEVTHLPVQVGLRLLAALAAATLTAATVLLAEALTARGRLFAGPPARTVAMLPFAVGASLAAAGQFGTTVLFGGLYFLSAALVLAVAAWICRGPRRALPIVLVGAALAAFNEVAVLAVPLATVALYLRVRLVRPVRLVGENPPTSAPPAPPAPPVPPVPPVPPAPPAPVGRPVVAGLRPAVLLWLGFLPVFLPVRLLLWAACRDGKCYRNSDVLLGADVGPALANRLTAWLPPLQWVAGVRGGGRPGLVVLAVAGLVLAVLAARLLRSLPGLVRLDRRQAAALSLTGGALLLLGALLGSENSQTQEIATAGRWGDGWRDSPLTAAGGMLALAGALTLASRAVLVRRPAVVARAALVVLVLAGAVSAATGNAFELRAARLPTALLSGHIAAEIAQFDTTAAGDARRCALLDQFAALFAGQLYTRFASGELPQTHNAAERMRVTADMATEQMYGRPFCQAGR
jgi:hypothetical protein